MKTHSDVEIPEQARSLPVERGFVVPAVTSRRDNGSAKFGLLDGLMSVRCIFERRCQLCFEKIEQDYCFPGGRVTSYYTEPALHPACARYSLQVCPMILRVKDKFGITVCQEYVISQTGEVDFIVIPLDGTLHPYDEFMRWSEPGC